MTPPARLAAAIQILDQIVGGAPAEKTLTNWARSNRFAGSGDRHAIRDIVFDTLRRKRSCAHLGGGQTGRALILGWIRMADMDIASLFDGSKYGPAKLSGNEVEIPDPPDELTALDCPEWIAPALRSSLKDGFAPVMQVLQTRAPVFLRVHAARSSVEAAIADLAKDDICATPHPLAKTALEVQENARKIRQSAAFLSGKVELQDAASQAVVEALPLKAGQKVLDFCAGGGGKALAMLARERIKCFAHDIDPERMSDIPARAGRAGAMINILDRARVEAMAPFDLVLADVPCSGSGSWRRAPEGKWALTPERLAVLSEIQSDILDKAADLVRPGGYLCYATCSLLEIENQDQIAAFQTRKAEWAQTYSRTFTPLEGGDGFFIATLKKNV